MSAGSPLWHAQPPRLARTVSLAQGAYYLMTGAWPLLSLRSFEKVTGPKVDDWLVKTVGMMTGLIGGVLVLAGLRPERGPVVPLLGAGSAAVLLGVDVFYVAKSRIRATYLLDAVPQGAFVAGWALAGRRAAP